MAMDEITYRAKIKETLDRVEKAFDQVDPDLAECSQAQGALTIQLADGSRCILSAQPSVRQLWMAVASKGIAFHFNWDVGQSCWKDDKGKGIELISYLSSYLAESAKVSVQI